MTFALRVAFPIFLLATLCSLPLGAGAQVDEDAAMTLAKRSQCFKCHAVDKRKKAPSYKDVAAKYRGSASAEKDIFLHITGNPVVQPDGGDEKHTSPDTKDEGELFNLVRWILSR